MQTAYTVVNRVQKKPMVRMMIGFDARGALLRREAIGYRLILKSQLDGSQSLPN